MADVIELREDNRVEKEAAKWVVRLDGGIPDESDLDQFCKWLGEDARHRSEFTRLARLWGSIDSLSALAELIPLNEIATDNPAGQGVFTTIFGSPRTAALGGAIGAVLVAVAVYFGLAVRMGERATAPVDIVYETPVGSQEEIFLPDGSIIQLNTDTRLEVAFTEATRNVVLRRGEAHFRINSDPGRPFSVFTGRGKVVAIGTAFNIRLEDNSVHVIVTDGKVEVFPSAPSDKGLAPVTTTTPVPVYTDGIFLSEGNALKFGAETREIDPVEPQDLVHDLAWQRGMLIFEGESLEEAINEINRYTNMQIVIADPDIREIRVGGYFKAGETRAMLDAFESIFGLRVTQVGPELIHISGNPE